MRHIRDVQAIIKSAIHGRAMDEILAIAHCGLYRTRLKFLSAFCFVLLKTISIPRDNPGIDNDKGMTRNSGLTTNISTITTQCCKGSC